MRLRDAVREPGFAALALLPAVLFWRVLVDGTFFFRDLYLFGLPQRLKVASALRSGALPLWDATLHGGQPLLSNPNNTALYPATLLYGLLPPLAAFNIEILLHLALAAAGTYLLARTLAFSRVAAFVTGLVVAFSGPSLSLVNLLNRHLAAAWAPFVLLFWHLFLRDRRPLWCVATAAAFALHLLGGFPELALTLGALLAVWTAASDPPTGRGSRAAPFVFLAVTLLAGIGLAAPQILPAVRLLPGTIRGQGFGPASVLSWSVDPRRLAELALPGLFGRIDGLSESSYLGRTIEDEGFPYLVSLAFGVGTLLLATRGLRASGELSSRRARTLAVFSGALILLSLGRRLPGIATLVGLLPPFPVRYPEKLVSASVLPIALLAGAGLDRTLRGGAEARPLARLAAVSAFLLGGLAALEALAPSFARRVAEMLFELAPSLVSTAVVTRALLASAVAAGLMALSGSAASSGRTRIAAVLASVAVAGPLVGQARELAPVAPRSLFGEPGAARPVRVAVGGGLLYRSERPGPATVEAPTDDVAWLARRNRERLAKYTAAGVGIPVVFHLDFDGLASVDEQKVARLVERLDWAGRVPVLGAAGVTALLSDEPISATGVVPVPAPAGLFLYRLPGARVAAFLTRTDEAARVEVLPTARADQRLFRTTSLREGTLTLTTPFFEGWSARVDGESAPVRRTNGYMQGVAVPAGSHVVELSYWPPGLTAGLVLSALSAAALVAVLAARRLRALSVTAR